MSDFRSFLYDIHKKRQNMKKHNRIIVAVTVCTLATGTLILTGEEQHVRNINITAEAKENPTYQTANIENPSYQLLLMDSKGEDKTQDTDLVSKYCTDTDSVVSTIIEHTKEQVQDVIDTKKQILESDLKESARVQKEEAKRKANRMTLSARDKKVLERIVEAEAGDQDVMGRMLVANVVLNRVRNKEFPDNVKDVVFEHRGCHYQFSPAGSGSIHRVTVSKTTKKAVKRVLNGEDESRGALYFVQRNIANKNSLSWFDRDLTRLFKHGCHTFYK